MAAETAAAADFGSALHGMLGFAFLGDALFWGLLACLSVPHWLYAWVWTRPEAWKRLVASVFGANGRHPVDAFAATATLLKLFQFSAVLVWYAQRGPFEVPALWQVAIGSVLFVFGQILNVSIYTAIGTDGVYYGIKLGRPVPWCTSFPFSVFNHPQYLGSACTILGIVVLGATPQHIVNGAFVWAAIWCSFYTVSGYVEDNFGGRLSQKDK